MTKKLPLLLTLIAAITLAFATNSLSSSPQGAGKVSTRDFPFVTISGDDISSLPGGENRLVVGSANGGVWKLTNGGSSADLTKTGTGTLILPNANRAGVTKVGPGTLKNSNTPAQTKELTGTLILTAPVDVVYEFTQLGMLRFSKVFVRVAADSANSTDIKSYVQQRRPAAAMKGWPFSRLLLGPPAGIAKVEGWKPAAGGSLTDKPAPGSKYVCSGNFCACSGTADCLSLVNSGACSGDMNCDGSGSGVKCYCKK